jgi:hypothetical protein
LDAKGKRTDLAERVLPFFVPDVIAPPILPQQYATANEMIEILLRNLLRNKAIDSLNPREKCNNEEDQLPMNTKVHNNEDELLGSFLLRSPFPITRTIHVKYYLLYYGGERKSLKRVMQRQIDRSDIESPLNLQHGLIYWKFELTLEYMEFNMDEVEDYGVLLSSHGSSEQGVYTVVWKN